MPHRRLLLETSEGHAIVVVLNRSAEARRRNRAPQCCHLLHTAPHCSRSLSLSNGRAKGTRVLCVLCMLCVCASCVCELCVCVCGVSMTLENTEHCLVLPFCSAAHFIFYIQYSMSTSHFRFHIFSCTVSTSCAFSINMRQYRLPRLLERPFS